MPKKKKVDKTAWDETWESLEVLRSDLKDVVGLQVDSLRLRSRAKGLVQDYFRRLRPELVATFGLDTTASDELMQQLLLLSNSRAAKRSYARIISDLREQRNLIEIQRERKFSENAFKAIREPDKKPTPTETEETVVKTLESLLPDSAISYRQVIKDVGDISRVSYRGTVAELREVLREVLDHLAPDKSVMSAPDFKLEKNQTRPTMGQKVRFILHSRGLQKTAISVPEETVALIEERAGSLTRATYNRGSLAAHTQATRNEARQLKRYVDTILCELLEIY